MWNIFKKNKAGVFGKYEYTNFEEPVLRQALRPETQHRGAQDKLREANLANFQSEVIGGEVVQAGETGNEVFEGGAPLLKKVVRALILGLTFLMPLFFLTFNAPGDVLAINKQVLLYAVAAASLLIWLAIIVRQGGLNLKLSGFEWGVLAVVAAGLLASLFSSQVYRSFVSSNGFISLASFGALFVLTVNFFEKRDAGKLVSAFIAGSFLAILSGVLSAWGAPVFKWLVGLSGSNLVFDGQFNSVGSSGNLGALAVLTFVLALGQYFYPLVSEEEGGALNFLNFGAVIISGLLLLILDWWVFYTVLVFGMLAVLLGPGVVQRFTSQKVKMKPAHIVAPLVVLVLSLVLIFSNRYFGFGVSAIFSKQTLPIEVSLSQRGSVDIAKSALSINPVFGVGPGNFGLAYDQFRPLSINETRFWNTRFLNSASEFFNLATEGGLLALAAFVFLLFFVLRSLKDWKIGPAFIAAMALFFLFPFNLVLMFTLWFLIGLLAITSREKENQIQIKMDDASLSSIISSLAFVLVLVFGLVGGYMLFQKYSGEVYIAKAAKITGSSGADLDNAINLVGKAANADSGEDLYLSNLANMLLRKINLTIQDKSAKPEEIKAKIENLTRTVIQIANQMTSNHQNEASNWFNAGFIYENIVGLVSGADNAAITAYGEYAKRVKNDPRGYERIGSIYLSRADSNSIALQNAKAKQQEIKNEKEINDLIAGDYKNAEANFKKAIELKRDLASSLYSLGTVYDREGKLKEAIKQLELIKILNLNNPGLAFELGLLYYRDSQKDKA